MGQRVSEESARALVQGRRAWWVNQNQTYADEVSGNFLWSPKRNRNGARNQFYENMTLVSAGDLVFSFCRTQIRAIGVATGPAESSRKPKFASGGEAWSEDGWIVPVEFSELDQPFRPKDHMAELRPHLPRKYSPLQANGNGLQSVYLAEVSSEFATLLLDLARQLPREVLEPAGGPDWTGEREIAEFIAASPDLAPTEKEQLVLARRGQGTFRTRVRVLEPCCRVTRTSDIRHLRASHIKPWAASTNAEKLDGANGLLLAPHIDHLFDRGWMSFEKSGRILVSPRLDGGVLARWGVDPEVEVGGFSEAQDKYLDYHRSKIFRRR